MIKISPKKQKNTQGINMNFLPQDYQAPKSSNNYAKLVEGENRFRILTAPIFGWEDWINNKPIRFNMQNKPVKSNDPKKPLRHFWTMIVWNYDNEQIQILHITQATIRNNIQSLCKDEDWGAPYGYDIKIMKMGEGTDTAYVVNPVPHKPIDPSVIQAFRDKPCYLEAMYTNEDPFAPHEKFTKGAFDIQDAQQEIPNEIKLLQDVIDECSPEFKQKVKTLMDNSGKKSLSELDEKLIKKIKNSAYTDRDAYAEILKQNLSEIPF
jgi:hypothetical protein